jgi:hypothetical protein
MRPWIADGAGLRSTVRRQAFTVQLALSAWLVPTDTVPRDEATL